LNREESPIPNIFHSIDEEDKKNIILDPSFILDGKIFRFDFLSTTDYQSIGKMLNAFSNVSSQQNKVLHKIQDINTDNDTSIDVDELKNTFIDEINKQKDTLDSSLKITDKKLITVRDFEEIYSIGEETQRKLRGRFPKDDPLPCIQTAKRGTVLYDPNVIDKWMDNYRNNEG
jgi:hypothetical protein